MRSRSTALTVDLLPTGQLGLDLVAADGVGGSQVDGISFTYYDGGDGTGRADVYQQVNGTINYVTTVVTSAYASGSWIGLRYTGDGSDGLTLYTQSASRQSEQVWQGDPGIDGPAYAVAASAPSVLTRGAGCCCGVR